MILKKTVSDVGVFLTSSFALVSAVSFGDMTVIFGVLSAIVTIFLNIRKSNRDKASHELLIEKQTLENKKLKAELDKLLGKSCVK